ncbi:NifB/NifX family molybdenum-iron cluster-binding protein [candidate division KSB1 bacterium]|nr:NifB/NifX family molybdenum-iron cluster-binding protein [candidate division KSB1 bacterium]
MKVAISTDNSYVSAHFGRCPQFTILDIQNGQIVNKQTIENPGHEPGYLPEFMQQQQVEAVIAGGGGKRAQMLFAEKGIQFILGIQGTIDDTIDLLCKGELKGGESLCTTGGHGDGNHNCDHGGHHH